MQKNFGTKDVTQEGDDEIAEIVYLCPSALTNLYDVHDTCKKGNHVYIENRKENFFVVTSKKGLDARFTCNDRGLYVRESTSPTDCCVYNYLGNHIEGFTKKRWREQRKYGNCTMT